MALYHSDDSKAFLKFHASLCVIMETRVALRGLDNLCYDRVVSKEKGLPGKMLTFSLFKTPEWKSATAC